MNGSQRSDVGIDTLCDELRVSYIDDVDMEDCLNMAQLEWATWCHSDWIITVS